MRSTVSLFLSALLLGSGLTTSALAEANVFNVDNTHSNVLFKIRHNDVSYVFGRFNDFSGEIRWSEEDPGESGVSLTIEAMSVDTDNERRDRHLRSPDFFNARQFPEITFTSSEVNENGDDTYEVTGDVTLLGESKPVAFTWKHTGAGPGGQGEFRRGGIATFTVKRSDFGMDFMPDRLGDEVELIVSLQAVRE